MQSFDWLPIKIDLAATIPAQEPWQSTIYKVIDANGDPFCTAYGIENAQRIVQAINEFWGEPKELLEYDYSSL